MLKSKDAFESILDLPDSECQAFLQQLDANVRDEVEELLRQDQREDSLFEISLRAAFGRPEVTDPCPLLGRKLGPYELIREVGRGGSSVVYLARRADDLYQKQVAIKVLNQPCSSIPTARRFQLELMVLARLDHESMVRLLDAGTSEEGFAYIVTEFVDGMQIDLFASQLSVQDKLKLLQGLTEGLSIAHRNNVIHGDIKPQNILVTPEGKPKILDFGVSSLVDQQNDLTETGLGRMTIRYASPEQLKYGKATSPSSDMFSLGVVMYELLCGMRPFHGNSIQSLTDAVLTQEPAKPSSIVKNLPRELDAICLKLLHKAPEARYQSMEDCHADLTAFLSCRPVRAQSPGLIDKSWIFIQRNRLPVLSLLGVMTLVLIGMAYYWSQRLGAEQNLAKSLLISETLGTYATDLRGSSAKETLRRVEQMSTLFKDFLAHNPDSDTTRRAYWSMLFRVGAILAHPSNRNMGEPQKSVELLTAATQLASQLYQRAPNSMSEQVRYSQTACALGSVLIEQGKYAEAEHQFEAAVKVGAETANRSPQERAQSSAFADSLANLSRIRLHQGNANECLRLRRESLRIRRNVLNSEPQRQEFRYVVAGSLASLGWALREFHQPKAALAPYQEAISLIGGIDLTDPLGNVEAMSLAAKNHYELGRIHLKLAQRDMVKQNLKTALKFFRRIQVIEPDSVSNSRSTALALSLLASISRRDAESNRMAKEAVRLAETAARIDLSNAKAMEDLETVRSNVSEILTRDY